MSNANTNSKWNKFLGEKATEVDGLIIKPPSKAKERMEKFRKRIRPFAKRWKRHYSDSEKYERKRRKHWEKVKQNPAWQDKTTGPPKKGWEWDRLYLFNLVGLSDSNPINDMPAKYVPDVMAAIKKYRKRNEKDIQHYAENSNEYKRLKDAITKQRQNLADIRSEFGKLKSTEKKKAWIKTPPKTVIPNKMYIKFKWWSYLNLDEELVFGCWRPPLKKVTEYPVELLITIEKTDKLSPSRDKVEEYERYYVILASIHDNLLPATESITGSVWPDKLAEQVWGRLSWGQPYGPDEYFIKAALERVKADLVAGTLADKKKTAKKRKKKQKKSKGSIKDRFSFAAGQVLFDDKDLELPTGENVDTLKKLVEAFGRTVPYDKFDKCYSSATPGTLPKTITRIRKNLKQCNVPCEIIAKTNEGYLLRELPPTKHKRVRKK